MLGIYDITDLFATSFFDGDTNLAGMVIYVGILLLLFGLSRKTQQTLILSLPVTLIFGTVGVLNTDMMVLLIIVTVLALAFTARKAWSD